MSYQHARIPGHIRRLADVRAASLWITAPVLAILIILMAVARPPVAHARLTQAPSRPHPVETRVITSPATAQQQHHHVAPAPAHHHHYPPRHHIHAPLPLHNYSIYDSTLPQYIPAKAPAATYVNGPFSAQPGQVRGHHVLWIDTQGTDPHANAVDTEPGDATPQSAASWAANRLKINHHFTPVIYTMISEWPQVRAAVTQTVPASLRGHVKWWIADPTGTPHIVPGSQATQWSWGKQVDVSLATPQFSAVAP